MLRNTLNYSLLYMKNSSSAKEYRVLTKEEHPITVKRFDEVQQTTPSYSTGYFRWQQIPLQRKEPSSAIIRKLTQQIESQPNDSNPYLNRGKEYLRNATQTDNQDHFASSITDFSEAIRLSPKNFEGYFQRGCAYYERAIRKQSKEDEVHAIADFNRAIQLRGDSSEAFKKKGHTYFNMTNYSEAIKNYQEAIMLKKDDLEAFFFKGCAHYHQKEYSKAQQVFCQALQICPQVSNLKENRSTIIGCINHIYFIWYVEEKSAKFLQSLNYITAKEVNEEVLNQVKTYKDQISSLKEGSLSSTREILNIEGKFKEIEENIEKLKKKLKQRKAGLEEETEVKKIQQQIDQLSKRVFVEEKVIQKIKGLKSEKQAEYYLLLYLFIVDHFLTFQACFTGSFSESSTKFSGAFEFLLTAQPVIDQFPILSDLIGIPFRIMDQYRQIKLTHLNKVVADKMSSSNFSVGKQVTEYLAFVIESLLSSEEFNQQLMRAISKEDKLFVEKLFKKATNASDFIIEKIFDSSESPFSFVQEVVIAQMTLVILKMYEIDSNLFQHITTQKQLFYNLILETIDGRPKKIGCEQRPIKDQSTGDIKGDRKQQGCCGSGEKCIIY